MPDFDDFVSSLGEAPDDAGASLELLRRYHEWLVPELRRSSLGDAICALGEVARQWGEGGHSS